MRCRMAMAAMESSFRSCGRSWMDRSDDDGGGRTE
eukprot:CAMPEP_0184514750 /NCGR_PEP_ID=MMETSP0198_2-20121128/4131_1 /TAXON_ID=1112570 /ORGANISM="Thraustochytrium sp., Strain LLF1b" /LENGTH=34 /DNA_ID= /DNA_START= /DNA_END= /DNA_ORIENTATION=